MWALVLRVLDYLDDVSIRREVRRRLRNDTGERMTLEELVAEVEQGYETERPRK